ncbi:Predicted dehydrogenase [Propionibacterium cyclohexanicum]|uniref:Predicted dehydrogenase n=1 Tax=Propionibacterium cyclohexanicum TaxID=64702 RepID=A0A1H9TVU6_9ACTN|nr:Gfo/Idh/MocA family oxidoreductase [Propionibacterium cyclohexanicum]SES01037.1 Predicted dehydrogenase [Propionibacterium cyclohexanicum]
MTIRWGIAGPGRISHTIAAELAAVADAELVAVGSRSEDRAQLFAAEFSIPHAHGSYRALVTDPDVDVVYIGTPHPQHHPLAMAAIEAGKAVLVEKAMTCTVERTRELAQAARAAKVFAMEAVWTRFLPATRLAHELVDEGRIGELTAIQGDLFAHRDFNATDRLFAPELAGGAMLDLGVYVLHFAQDFLGAPSGVEVTGSLLPNGVDGAEAIQLRYDSGVEGLGRTAQLSCGLTTYGPGRMVICGTQGYLEVLPRFHHPSRLILHHGHDEPEVIERPYEGLGYRHELAAVTEAMSQGLTEHPLLPLDDSIAVAQAMTIGLAQLGYQPADATEI